MAVPMHALRRPATWYALLVAVVIVLGVHQYWPTLQLGLFSDDYLAEAMADGRFGVPRSALDLFNFVDGSPNEEAALKRLGMLPWWTPPDFRIAFMRPLSSALLYVDRALFGPLMWARHVHSIVIWIVLCVASAALYRRLFSITVAAIATATFCLDESQHGPVVWLCNRGGTYAVLFGVLGLAAHLRYRIEGRRAFAWWSALCLSIGLLFGEWVLPMFAYLLAFELLGAADPWRKRALAILPASVLALCFLIARAILGYGARSSGVYVDPAENPLGFAALLLHRVPVLAADLIATVPADWWDFGSPWRYRILKTGLLTPEVWARMPDWHSFHVSIGLAVIALSLLVLRGCWHGFSAQERNNVRWLLLGSLLALTPVVGSFPSTRLTLSACFGFAPALALVLRHVGRSLLQAHKQRLARFLLTYATGVMLVELQLFAPLREDLQAMVDGFTTTTKWVLAAPLDIKRMAKQRVYVLAATEFTTTYFFAGTWNYFGRPLPRSFYPLSVTNYAHNLTRTADNTFLLTPLGGAFLESSIEVHFRPRNRVMHEREVFTLPGMSVEVVRMLDGLPLILRFVFDRSLDDPSNVFLVSKPDGISRFTMPKVGETVLVPRASGPSWPALDRGRYERRFGPFPEMLRYEPRPAFVEFDPAS
jgi:hypothetical protein